MSIIITIVVGFANMIIETLELVKISYTLDTISNIDPSFLKINHSPS